MYKFRIAYRFQNGEVKGYVGYGFNKELAKENAYKKIYEDLSFLKEPFSRTNVILSKNGVSKEEMALIRKDWKVG